MREIGGGGCRSGKKKKWKRKEQGEDRMKRVNGQTERGQGGR